MPNPPWTKTGSSMALMQVVADPLVRESAAVAIAEVMLRDRWNQNEAAAQMPLRVQDAGEVWRIIGMGHGGTEFDPDRWFCMLIRKNNGEFIEIGIFSGPGGIP